MHEAVQAMDDKANIQCNKLMKLDNSKLMCGIYNAETLEKLINTVHRIHNTTSSHERLFAGEHSPSTFKTLYAHSLGLQHYSTNSLSYLRKVRKTLQITNPDYDLVIDRLHLYYDMPLITFGIDKNMNLIIQFPIFVQPYTQKPLILYQLESVPIPILDQNIKAQPYTHLQIKKTLHCPQVRNIYFFDTARIKIK